MPTRLNVQEIDTGATITSSLTLPSYTPSAGKNRVLEVMVAYGRNSSATCSVTFGGVSMTLRATQGNASVCARAFTLNENQWPASTADIVATLGTESGARIIASTITDVNQITPVEAAVTYSAGTNVNPWTFDITTVTSNTLISVLGAGLDVRSVSSLASGLSQVRLDTDIVDTNAQQIGTTLLYEYTSAPSPSTVPLNVTWNTNGHALSAAVAVAYRVAPPGQTVRLGTSPVGSTFRINQSVTSGQFIRIT